ncbi:MAG: hypothetical protein K2Q22_04405 [Cytophagales bacterium]|nr:hypothetical protein [Cytophagales bacterium]
MRLNDFIILAKKILVGIAIFLVPFSVIFGGLYATQHLLEKPAGNTESPSSSPVHP